MIGVLATFVSNDDAIIVANQFEQLKAVCNRRNVCDNGYIIDVTLIFLTLITNSTKQQSLADETGI